MKLMLSGKRPAAHVDPNAPALPVAPRADLLRQLADVISDVPLF